MENSAQKPVDSKQIALDVSKSPTAPAVRMASLQFGSGLAFKVGAVVFIIGNVIALYILHFVNRSSPTTRFAFSSFAATSETTARVGDVVSLSSSSALRNGAGTTAYLDRMTITDTADFLEYINFSPLGTSKASYTTNLLSYRRTNGVTVESVLTTVTTHADKTVTVSGDYDKSANVIPADAIRGLATLSDVCAIVLTASGVSPYTVNVMPATIAAGDSKVTLNQAKKAKVADQSLTNMLAPLTNKAFVVAYYEPWVASPGTYAQRVKVGTVDASQTISFSTNAPAFGPNNDANFFTTFGRPARLGDSGAFVIPYYSSTSNATVKDQESGLCVTMATYDSQANAIRAFTTGVCHTKLKPRHFVESVMVTSNLLAVAFHDADNNNALTVALVWVSATKAYFRSTYVLPSVAGAFEFGTQWGFSPKPSLAVLAGNRLALSFLNPAMDGKQSLQVLKISPESFAIKDVTPVLPVAKASFSLDISSGGVNKAITQELIAVSDDGVLAAYLGKRGTSAHQQFTLLEAFGRPVGVLRDYDGKRDASVAISGKATDVSTANRAQLVPGQLYYATTAGSVVTPSTTGGEYFVASEDAKLLVTADSKIGVAVDKDELFVSTAL